MDIHAISIYIHAISVHIQRPQIFFKHTKIHIQLYSIQIQVNILTVIPYVKNYLSERCSPRFINLVWKIDLSSP